MYSHVFSYEAQRVASRLSLAFSHFQGSIIRTENDDGPMQVERNTSRDI